MTTAARFSAESGRFGPRYTAPMTDRHLALGNRVASAVFRRVLTVGRWMPLGALRRLGRGLALAAIPLTGRHRKRELEHLKIAFPDLGPSKRKRLRWQSEMHFGQVLGEIAWLCHASEQQVLDLCDIVGEHHLFDALEQGRGVVLITAHAGNWEILNARLCLAGIPMTIAVRDVFDPRIDSIATAIRSRFGTEVVHRGRDAGKFLFRALANNRVDGLLIDQDIRSIPGVFVPFFGRTAFTPSGAASLALKAGCPVIPAFGHRRPDGRHLVEVLPALPIPTTGSPEDRVTELTATATAAIEQHIRKHPAQWVWMHRRWRTRPGDPKLLKHQKN